MEKYHYFEFEGFQYVYLEDSFVLEIRESQNEFLLMLEVVLTEKHPLYSLPTPSEMYCYKTASINFPDVKAIDWQVKNSSKYLDANGEYDLGNIDSFFFEGDYYFLDGDWGKVKIKSSKPVIYFQSSRAPK
ncbi:MAG: hypothetical protein DHS20C20_17090 [Ardenticatenaceae bacterium]|nr:MAG: hypothetical protein DHS20C20_17090 [Ardenticatenaceae bacterium]